MKTGVKCFLHCDYYSHEYYHYYYYSINFIYRQKKQQDRRACFLLLFLFSVFHLIFLIHMFINICDYAGCLGIYIHAYMHICILTIQVHNNMLHPDIKNLYLICSLNISLLYAKRGIYLKQPLLKQSFCCISMISNFSFPVPSSIVNIQKNVHEQAFDFALVLVDFNFHKIYDVYFCYYWLSQESKKLCDRISVYCLL